MDNFVGYDSNNMRIQLYTYYGLSNARIGLSYICHIINESFIRPKWSFIILERRLPKHMISRANFIKDYITTL